MRTQFVSTSIYLKISIRRKKNVYLFLIFILKALKTLRNSDLMPYIIYIGPPNLAKLKELKVKLNESYKVYIYIF